MNHMWPIEWGREAERQEDVYQEGARATQKKHTTTHKREEIQEPSYSPNAKDLKIAGYRKCPSVTGGGKRHFWVKRVGNVTSWVVWNRVVGRWVIINEGV